MALVVLLKGINVGGHRSFRPSVLANALKRYDVVNVGAAGTFLVRNPVGRTELRAAITRRLPFEAEVVICSGTDVLRLTSTDPFAGQPSGPSFIPFASVLARRRPTLASLPLHLPDADSWVVRVLAQHDRFVLGIHRREMKAISCLAQLDKVFGAPMTTRSWSTMVTLARMLES